MGLRAVLEHTRISMLARQLLCLLLLMLASTGAAVAQISISSGDAQQGAPGQSLPQTLAVQNFDTAGSWDVLWHINFDETNGASLSHLNDLDTLTSDVVVNIPSGATDGVTLTFGPSGGTVQVDVCPATNPGTGWFCATTPLTFTATAVAPSFSLTKISADPINATVGDGIQATVRVLDGLGLPVAGQDIQFAAAAGSVTPETQTIATDVNGFATATMTALVAGNQPNALSATLDPDGIPANADDQVVSFTFNFLAGPPSFSADLGADNQSGNPGDTLPLPLNATNSGGTGIALWRIITDGSNGATLNLAGDLSSPPDDAAISIPTGGTAGPTLTLGPDAGSVSIEACEGQLQTMGYVCINPPSFHTFAAVALPKMLVKVTPDPVSADVGSSFDVSVRLEDGLGNPVAGSSISFAATPGVVSPANTSAVTGAGGVATASFSADQAGSFPSAMSVIYDPDGIPSNGNELLATYGFSFATPAPGILNKPSVNSGDNQTLTVGDRIAMPLRVLARTGAGTPEANVTVNWSVLQGAAQLDAASTLTDSSGYTGMGLVATAAGTIVVRAERADVPAAYEEFTLSALAPASLSIEGGDGQVASPGSTGDDLVVQLLLDGSPFGGGQIAWAVESGDATLTDSHSGTDAGGLARVGISFGTGVGPVVVSASSEDPPAGPVYFHLDVAPPSSIVHLEIHAGDHQNGPITTAGDNPLVVSLTDGDGAPIDDATVYWEVIGGDASVDGVSSSTEGGGFAAMTFRFGAAAGASTIRASLTGGDIYRDFEVTAYVPQLIQQGGDGQSGLTGSELPEDFVVSIAPPVSPIAKSLTGVDIHWQVIEGGGSLSATTTPTDGDGQARVRLRLGPAPGNNVVRAEIAGGPTLLFNATGYNTPPAAMLRIVSGDGQQIPTTSPSAPLVVETLDGDDEPLSGVALDWSIDNGSLSAASTSTGSDGQSSNVAQVAISGTAVVNVAVHGSPELAVSFTLNGGVANILDLTDDEHEVAVAIDTLCPALLAMDSHTPEQHDLLERCLELLDNAGDHPDDVVHALDEMMQDTALVQAHSALLAASTQFGNINQRLNALRAGRQQPLSLDGLSLANSSGIMPLALLPEAGDGETGTDFSRWGFFANGTLGRGDSDGGRSRPQYDYDTSGLTAGVDYRVNDHWFAGVALGYTRQDNSLGDDQGRVDMRGWSVSGYTTWFNTHNWYVDAVLNWGSNDYDMQRRIAYQIAGSGGITRVDQVAQASSSGDQSYAALSFGRDFQKGAWSIGPYLRASWARVSFDAYQESLPGSGAGSGLGLAVAARDVDAAMLVLGGKASRAISTDWGVLMPSLSLEWEHQLQDDPQHVVAHFLADPTRTPFEIRGTPLDRDYYRLGIGLSALWANGRSGFVSYEHLIGASGISQGTLSLGLRFEF